MGQGLGGETRQPGQLSERAAPRLSTDGARRPVMTLLSVPELRPAADHTAVAFTPRAAMSDSNASLSGSMVRSSIMHKRITTL